mgnify:CR=1 FL=1
MLNADQSGHFLKGLNVFDDDNLGRGCNHIGEPISTLIKMLTIIRHEMKLNKFNINLNIICDRKIFNS